MLLRSTDEVRCRRDALCRSALPAPRLMRRARPRSRALRRRVHAAVRRDRATSMEGRSRVRSLRKGIDASGRAVVSENERAHLISGRVRHLDRMPLTQGTDGSDVPSFPVSIVNPEKCLMRRRESRENVSTYVRTVGSEVVSSTVSPPMECAQRILYLERSVLPAASGVYITIHTQLDALVDGTNRSDGVKSTHVRPSERRTSAWTFNVDCRGLQG